MTPPEPDPTELALRPGQREGELFVGLLDGSHPSGRLIGLLRPVGPAGQQTGYAAHWHSTNRRRTYVVGTAPTADQAAALLRAKHEAAQRQRARRATALRVDRPRRDGTRLVSLGLENMGYLAPSGVGWNAWAYPVYPEGAVPGREVRGRYWARQLDGWWPVPREAATAIRDRRADWAAGRAPVPQPHGAWTLDD